MSKKKQAQVEPDVYLEPTPAHAIHVLKMLADFFGSEKSAITFMQSHAGCTIIVPKQAVVERLAMELSVAESLDRDPSTTNAIRLSSLHGIQRRVASRAYQTYKGKGITARRNEQHCRHPRLSRLRVRVVV